ncbi:hypothetical protein HUN41_00224 [Streptomyces phage Coruscant]|uniref:Uncharacterized protein n=1 Tax=Streptomyces phage Coruscant TaxID=2739834 RepID=A0A7G4AWC6_9CAUD|nr:hypothetical protein PP454_gp101 [Streptomyces phage Coruscant]QMP84316.1 hypothetical protein HUN41_00224 [Streptomyces phage Coruscant]
MYPSPNIKFTAIVSATLFGCVSVITGAILYGVKIGADTERACLESDRVYVHYTCVDRIEDLRYIDD